MTAEEQAEIKEDSQSNTLKTRDSRPTYKYEFVDRDPELTKAFHKIGDILEAEIDAKRKAAEKDD